MYPTLPKGSIDTDFLEILYLYYTKKVVQKCTSIDGKKWYFSIQILKNVHQYIDKRDFSIEILTKCTPIDRQDVH